MELKPVVYNNNALSFESSAELTYILAFLQGRLVVLLAGLWWVTFNGSVRLFNIPEKNFLAYTVMQLGLLALSTMITIYQVNRIRPVVSKIAYRITITDDAVSIIPFSFGMFFWTRKSKRRLDFKIAELKIRKTDNPLRFTSALDNRVFKLRDKKKEAYVVFDFFDKTLKEKLTDILVEVTPPELLLPGRLRHY